MLTRNRHAQAAAHAHLFCGALGKPMRAAAGVRRELSQVRQRMDAQGADDRIAVLADQTLGRRTNYLLLLIGLLAPIYIVGQGQPALSREQILSSAALVAGFWSLFGLLPCHILREFLVNNPLTARDFLLANPDVKATDFVPRLLGYLQVEQEREGVTDMAIRLGIADQTFQFGRRHWWWMLILVIVLPVAVTPLVQAAIQHLLQISGPWETLLMALGFVSGLLCVMYWAIVRSLQRTVTKERSRITANHART